MHCLLELSFLHKEVSHSRPRSIHPSTKVSLAYFLQLVALSFVPCPCPDLPWPLLELERPFDYYCPALTFFLFCPPFGKSGKLLPITSSPSLFQRCFQFIFFLLLLSPDDHAVFNCPCVPSCSSSSPSLSLPTIFHPLFSRDLYHLFFFPFISLFLCPDFFIS